MTSNYKGTKIGLVFTVIGILLHLTYAGGFVFVLPTLFIVESIVKLIIPNSTYSTIGTWTLIIFTAAFLLSTTIYIRQFLKTCKLNLDIELGNLVGYFAFQFLVIHSLIFQINLATNWNQAKDGQFILSVGEYFIYSSLFFIVFGFVLDKTKLLLTRK